MLCFVFHKSVEPIFLSPCTIFLPKLLHNSNKSRTFASTELVCIPLELQASHFFILIMNQNPRTIQQQIAILKLRGMAFSDENLATSYLTRISYFRLKYYWTDMIDVATGHFLMMQVLTLSFNGMSLTRVLGAYYLPQSRFWKLDYAPNS